jgi:hypothetical protein
MSEVQQKNSGLAIASLVLGILCLLCGVFASVPCIIVSHLALSDIKKNENLTGKGFAIFGLIAGYLITVLSIVYLIVIFMFGEDLMRAAQEQQEFNMNNMNFE